MREEPKHVFGIHAVVERLFFLLEEYTGMKQRHSNNSTKKEE